jgi:hypothetical protein
VLALPTEAYRTQVDEAACLRCRETHDCKAKLASCGRGLDSEMQGVVNVLKSRGFYKALECLQAEIAHKAVPTTRSRKRPSP